MASCFDFWPFYKLDPSESNRATAGRAFSQAMSAELARRQRAEPGVRHLEGAGCEMSSQKDAKNIPHVIHGPP